MVMEVFTLQSSDDQKFVVPRNVALKSKYIENLLDVSDEDQDSTFPVDVTGEMLKKIFVEYIPRYCKDEHTDAAVMVDDVPAVTEEAPGDNDDNGSGESTTTDSQPTEPTIPIVPEFVSMENNDIISLVKTVDYLDIPQLFKIVARAFAEKLNKMAEGVPQEEATERFRVMFGFKNDFEPEEYEKAKKELAWVWEDEGEGDGNGSKSGGDSNDASEGNTEIVSET